MISSIVSPVTTKKNITNKIVRDQWCVRGTSGDQIIILEINNIHQLPVLFAIITRAAIKTERVCNIFLKFLRVKHVRQGVAFVALEVSSDLRFTVFYVVFWRSQLPISKCKKHCVYVLLLNPP